MRVAVLAAVLTSLAFAVAPAGAITLPAGFADEQVAGVAVPTDLSPLPGGGLLVTSQTGQLRILRGTALSAPVLTLAVCDQRERGLLSVAAAPDFVTAGRSTSSTRGRVTTACARSSPPPVRSTACRASRSLPTTRSIRPPSRW